MDEGCEDAGCARCGSNEEPAKPLPLDDNTPMDDDARWDRWPCCPQCGRRRETFCPTCQLAGNDFRLAEYIPVPAPLEPVRGRTERTEPDDALEADSVLLMCPICEEAFAPQFYRRCPQCAHEFDDGIEMEEEGQSELTGRAIAVMVGLAVFFLLVLVYFWFLFR